MPASFAASVSVKAPHLGFIGEYIPGRGRMSADFAPPVSARKPHSMAIIGTVNV